MRNIAEVTTAVARGDLSRKITVDVKGEILELKNTINTMVDQLNGFASEVTRVAREVGTEGKLGGQAQVPGVAGTWKDLTDTVNVMAANLTEQVRGIVKVVTAVANGDLKQNLTVKSKGEVAALAETINNMTDTLATFADQVTTVAREVGVEGRLGGQANVPGAAGTWKDLTGNVNLLAANLTTQVRAIAEVATAVTKGDLTRSIQVDARGEVAELKDNINTMIDNLRLTTDRNTEQDWLKTNLAKFTNMLQGQRDLATVGRLLLSELTPLVNAQQGVIYQMENEETPALQAAVGLCRRRRQRPSADAAARRRPDRPMRRRQAPHADHRDARRMRCRSARRCSRSSPQNIIVLPVLFENQVKAVIELASVSDFTTLQTMFLEQLTASIGIVLNSIEATMQTEGLLKQSQQLAGELQTQQSELQQTNEQLEQKAQQLAERNVEVERKNQEIEQARRALEEKATELALTSKYKSEFLANMSHELRTPLNSILILGQQLTDNPDGNLTPKQVEFARTIHGAGTDLLNLISDILDLSKIESGTVTVDAEEIFFSNLIDMVGAAVPPRGRQPAALVRRRMSIPISAAASSPTPSACSRCSRTCCPTPSSSPSRAACGSTCRRPRRRLERRASGAQPGAGGGGVRGVRHRHRHSAGKAEDHLRGVPAGRCLAPAANTAAPASASPSAASCRTCSAAKSSCAARPAWAATFTLYLPLKYVGPDRDPRRDPAAARRGLPQPSGFHIAPERPVEQIPDDRLEIQPGDTILLIVEDDPHYARIMIDLARDKGFKVLVAMRGADALDLAKQYQPTAVSLDVFLPDMLGWTVLSQLKQNPLTRHIPVQIITLDEDRQHGLARGAFSFVTKPTTPRGHCRRADQDQGIRAAAAPAAAGRRGQRGRADEHPRAARPRRHRDRHRRHRRRGARHAARTALRLRGARSAAAGHAGFEVLEEMRDDAALSDVPVVVFTGRELSAEEDAQLHTMARSIVVKGVESPERLLDETALFLHRVVTDLPPEKQRMLERLNSSDEDLVGRTVLLVDDDARNIFALSSVLERRGMKVLTATTGREAIELIESTPDLAIVLMDIMMPEMDGYQTMETIREKPELSPAADHRADRQGDEGRPREMPGGGRVRLSRQAGQHRAAAVRAAHVAAPLEPEERSWRPTTRSTSCWSTTSRRSCCATR